MTQTMHDVLHMTCGSDELVCDVTTVGRHALFQQDRDSKHLDMLDDLRGLNEVLRRMITTGPP